ncbi:MAG: DEAD/DEAH box helicase family protein [Candidatus Nanoarchaeia archaeon]|nr:DEAD/DEAH box helicase family protein [Candidatus Nanoarchaeia archaeon]
MKDDISEAITRKEYIDKELEIQGWNKEYIKEEVNSVKSDFKIKKYEFKRGEGKEEGRFIDYLLLNENKSPLAIIEAKRFSFDPDKGSIQAVTYQKDIEAQTGYAIPIFLTNGNKWFLKERDYPTREVSGPFSQRDLHRRFELSKNKQDLDKVEVNTKIVDRSKSVEVVKQVMNHLNQGFRKALINMATGTGKTRVAMALIECLIKARHIQNVLLVVDRVSLERQANQKGFGKFLKSEPKQSLSDDGFSKDARMYTSTVQTLMSKEGPCYFQNFGPGFFDLIIFDEVHRSYYDKQKLVFDYFDAIKIGLTATPSDIPDKNTFGLFDCRQGKPTARYDYLQAVKDKVLVPYNAEIIETKVLTLGIKGTELTDDLKDELRKQEEDPDYFETPGQKYAKYFTDRKTNELVVMEFMNRCYKTGDLPCKTIFFCANVEHANSIKKVFDDLFPNLSNETVVIVSKKDRYMDEVKRFSDDSSPRIALSVGVLDTGIDIPEIMNLAFVAPVFSRIRFWQMLGRGTRNYAACTNRQLLPLKNEIPYKEDFKIFDFKFGDFSNVEYHHLEETKNPSIIENSSVKLFKKEVELLKKDLTDEEKKIVSNKILEDVSKIDNESFIVKPKRDIIKKIVSKKFDLDKYIDELKAEIAPLMKFVEGNDGKTQTFISKCVELFKLLKENNVSGIDKIKQFTIEHLENIWSSNLNVVKSKEKEIFKVFEDSFWDSLTFKDVEFLIKVIAPLMKYYEPERKVILHINTPDFVMSVKEFAMPYFKSSEIEDIKNNPLIKKMFDGGVTWKELFDIEKELLKLNSAWSIENIQKRMDFVIFLRNILELNDLPNPEQLIIDSFEKLIIQNNKNYNVEQIKFLRMLEKFFANNKHLTTKDLTMHPLSEENPLDKFSSNELKEIIKEVEKIKIK